MHTRQLDIDQNILVALATGDQQAFRTLYDLYWQELYSNACRYFKNKEDAEDCLHDVFVEIWAKRAQLDIQVSIRHYLHRALKNRILRVLSRADLHARATEQILLRFAEMQMTVLDQIAVKDLEGTIASMIESFPENMKKVFVLRNEDYSVKEIADALGLADQTVRNNINEAVKRLKSILQEQYPELSLGISLLLAGMN